MYTCCLCAQVNGRLRPLLSSRAAGCASTGRPVWLSPPRLHLWEDPAGEAPLADDNKVSCCSTI